MIDNQITSLFSKSEIFSFYYSKYPAQRVLLSVAKDLPGGMNGAMAWPHLLPLKGSVIDLRKIDNHIYHLVTPELQSGDKASPQITSIFFSET
jgi:hypothetical protein